MKTDLYTKVVLTMIAVLLTLNLVKTDGIITTANASPSPGFTQIPVNADGSIKVKVVQSEPQDVFVAGWRETSYANDTKATYRREFPSENKNGLPVRIITTAK